MADVLVITTAWGAYAQGQWISDAATIAAVQADPAGAGNYMTIPTAPETEAQREARLVAAGVIAMLPAPQVNNAAEPQAGAE